MPGQRNPNRTAISLWVEKELLDAIEQGRRQMRGMERSQFIRDAIKEKLEALGFNVPDDWVLPPDRASGSIKKAVQKVSGVGNKATQQNFFSTGASSAPVGPVKQKRPRKGKK